MKEILLILVMLLSNQAFAQVNKKDMDEHVAASLRLKQAHVEREWENCMLKASSEVRCKKLLNILWEQEKRVLAKLETYTRNELINIDALAKQSNDCYDGGDYTSLIKCRERLVSRLERALKGEVLLK